MGADRHGIHCRAEMKKTPVPVLMDWYKPFFKAGGPVRSMVNLVEHLQGTIDFHIVTGDRDYMAEAPPPGLRTNGWIRGDHGEMIWFASRRERKLKSWFELFSSR